jgi:hypothetical protein
MTELLTESFCERCGNRYELGTSEPMTTKQKTRGLVTGLRQFIMSTDSLEDSIGDAMRAEEQTLAARQIDAFQETFNFCLDCRRYTCVSCWNDDAGRCRSCMPVAGIDDDAGLDERMTGPALMPAPADGTPLLTTAAEPAWPAEEELPAPPLAWPTADEIPPAVAAEAAEPGFEEPELEVAAEVELPEPEVVPGFAAEEPELEVAVEVEVPEPEIVAEPGIVAEPEVIPEPQVVPGFAAEEPEAVEEPLEEPIAAAAELEPETPEPTPAEPPVRAPRRDLRDTFVRGPLVPRPAPSAEPVPESLAARRSQLDALGLDDHGEGAVSVGQREALPYRSSGAGSAAGSAALAAVWDASTRALEAGAGPQRASIRPCGACGLTVSSTARFCRRCGAPQTLSA